MSKERVDRHFESHQEDPFWNLDEEIGEGSFFGERYTIRLKAHVSEERYSKSEGEELVPLATRRGKRIYVMARPYFCGPAFRLPRGVCPQPTEQGPFGDGEASALLAMSRRRVGPTKAWPSTNFRSLTLGSSY